MLGDLSIALYKYCIQFHRSGIFQNNAGTISWILSSSFSRNADTASFIFDTLFLVFLPVAIDPAIIVIHYVKIVIFDKFHRTAFHFFAGVVKMGSASWLKELVDTKIS